jgi:hypothetical protein
VLTGLNRARCTVYLDGQEVTRTTGCVLADDEEGIVRVMNAAWGKGRYEEYRGAVRIEFIRLPGDEVKK